MYEVKWVHIQSAKTQNKPQKKERKLPYIVTMITPTYNDDPRIERVRMTVNEMLGERYDKNVIKWKN